MPLQRLPARPSRRVVASIAAITLIAALPSCERRVANPGTVDATDSLFATFDQPGMPGAAVVVLSNGAVVLQRSYGLADVEAGTPITSATNFRLASLSKAFTAAAVMLLAADGKLRLDDQVAKHLPALPAHARAITLRQLLSHTSGLADYEDFVPDSQTYQVKDADVLRLIAAHAESLYFSAGTAWRYSNTGYALLALVVERASGQRYADFLKERIFTPLGMSGTVAHEEGVSTVAHRAYGHRVVGDSVRRTDQSNTSAVLGDGGVYSSIDDMVRWVVALEGGTLLPDSLWREATMPYTLTDGRSTEYGFGWFIDRFDGRLRHRHHGETRGFTNSIYRFPEQRLTTIVLTNRSGSAPWDLNDVLARRYLADTQPESSTVRSR